MFFKGWMTLATRTGPNDASSVVWAISKFFFITLYVFSLLTLVLGTTNAIQALDGFNRAVATRTGPNDARRVVWAISKFFFISLRVFSLLTLVLGATNVL